MEWPSYLDEYEKLVLRMTTPRVMIDNAGCSKTTRIMIDSARKPGILLEAVRVLTDMNVSIKKANICSDGRWFMDVFHVTDQNGNKLIDEGDLNYIKLEFFIRHTDGIPISSEAEKQRVILCLQAAIQRRASLGVRLELFMADRRGLLADVMRTFRENGLNVTRAEISTIFREKGLNPTGDTAENVFYVTDASGNPADSNIIESVRQKVGMSNLIVKELPLIYHQATERDEPTFGSGGAVLLSLGSLVRRNLYNLGLIKSYS